MWPWSKRHYDKFSCNVVSDDIRRTVESIGCENIRTYDKTFLALEEKALRDFVYKYHDTSHVVYHDNSGEFPDCDDFSRLAVSDMVKAAIKEGMSYPPTFGTVSLTYNSGLRHMMNIAVTNKNFILLYEPQTRKWVTDLSDIKSWDEVEI